jgi:hypothetical protein
MKNVVTDNTKVVVPPRRVLIILQVLFWSFFFLSAAIFESQYIPFSQAGPLSLTSTLFYLTIVYVNSVILFPLASEKRQFVAYAFLAVTLLFACAMIKTKVSMFFFPNPKFTGFIRWEMVITGMVEGITALVVSTLLKFSYDYFKMAGMQQKIANDQLQSELKYLKMQINPHFLFNTLNSLLYLTQQKSDKAPDVVEKLGNMMRYMLEKSNEEKALLVSEIDFLQAYIGLEKIRIPHIQIQFTQEGDLDNHFIPSLILLPFVENAFKHGIDKSSNHNKVDIDLKCGNDKLTFVVTNQVKRIKSTSVQGIGLENLRKRLGLLYKNSFILETINSDGKYRSQLTIPFLP